MKRSILVLILGLSLFFMLPASGAAQGDCLPSQCEDAGSCYDPGMCHPSTILLKCDPGGSGNWVNSCGDGTCDQFCGENNQNCVPDCGASPDPNDPGAPDTVWLSRIDMSETLNDLGWPKQFAVKCSIFTDEELGGISIPISFYNTENLDILVDTMIWSDWVTNAAPDFDSLSANNDSVTTVNYSAKSFLGGAVWFRQSLPPGRGVLFIVYFNDDFFSVINWDTTKGIVLDTATFYPGNTEIGFFTPLAKSFIPIFNYGSIGGAVKVSGKVYKADGVTPDSGAKVFFWGKDRWLYLEEDTLLMEGRKGEVTADAMGNYQIVVGKDAFWCVFKDTSDQMKKDVNAYCWDSLTADASGIDFYGKYLPGKGAVISGTYYGVPPTPKRNASVYLDGVITHVTRTDDNGYYQFNVQIPGSYCVRTDPGEAKICDPEYSYVFSGLNADTSANDFKGTKPGGWVFISGTTWKTPPEPLPFQEVHLSGSVRSGVDTVETTTSDDSGYYEFRVVEKGNEYKVFMDTTGGLDTTSNAYIFKKLGNDTSNVDFVEPAKRGGWVTIGGLISHKAGVPWKNAAVYLYGYNLTDQIFRRDTTFTDSLGNYVFVVLMGFKYCVFLDSGGGIDTTNSYCFDSLVIDTLNNNFEVTTDVEEELKEAVPEHFALLQNYPNPFNPYTLIRFALPEDCEVRLEIYNILGQKVRTLANGFYTRGMREVVWDGKNRKGEEVASGIYFYKIQTENYTEVRKMILVK